jgi:hypothetical protein
MIDGFLLGIIVTCSLVAAAYFFRFWRKTRDSLFLCFSLAFLIEGLNRAGFLALDEPQGGSVAAYSIRLVSYLLLLAAIAFKTGSRNR